MQSFCDKIYIKGLPPKVEESHSDKKKEEKDKNRSKSDSENKGEKVEVGHENKTSVNSKKSSDEKVSNVSFNLK